MITRWQENRLVEMMGTRRGVNLTGARQSGKTTLSEIVRFPKQRRYTLDDKEIRRSAADDPKGFVKHETFCRANRYTPTISKEEYSQNFLGSVVERYFNNSYLDLVSAFAKKENFSLEELETLRKMIDDAIDGEKK